MAADERIEAARVNWLSRFVSAGHRLSTGQHLPQ